MKSAFALTAFLLAGLLTMTGAAAADQPSAMGGGGPVVKQGPNGALEGTDATGKGAVTSPGNPGPKTGANLETGGGGGLNQSTQSQGTTHKSGD